MLGSRVAEGFGPRLPFLMKALAAAEPLSLQVHPTSDRARAGYAAENAAGVPIGDPRRSYQDEFHKPELVYALTRFEGMAGFRDVAKSSEILRLFDLPWLDSVADDLHAGPPAETLHAVVTAMLATGGDVLADRLVDLGKAACAAEERAHRSRLPGVRRSRERTSVEREAVRVFAQTAALADRYPADPGVLVTLLLNHVVLSPGEAMFLDAGVIHAYTSGFGVEIMASSDNVVRAGLTPKHVDVAELLDIADFRPVPPPTVAPASAGRAVVSFEPPVTDFALHVVAAPSEALPAAGPRMVLGLDGEMRLASADGELPVRRGEAVFVPDRTGPIRLTGAGRVAVGAVPVDRLPRATG
jgi:mannose-6-phosphate isomerase